jgi:protein arginine kinase activator
VRKGAVEEELHLCESCAQQYIANGNEAESDEQEGFAVKLPDVSGEADLEELDQLVCPNCGITFREFRSQGRLGCPQEYIAFARELMPLLENIHGETQHTGKIPKRAPDASQRQYRLIKMRNQLRTAVEEEQYEEAARLRDEIQKLENELGQDREDS